MKPAISEITLEALIHCPHRCLNKGHYSKQFRLNFEYPVA